MKERLTFCIKNGQRNRKMLKGRKGIQSQKLKIRIGSIYKGQEGWVQTDPDNQASRYFSLNGEILVAD